MPKKTKTKTGRKTKASTKFLSTAQRVAMKQLIFSLKKKEVSHADIAKRLITSGFTKTPGGKRPNATFVSNVMHGNSLS